MKRITAPSRSKGVKLNSYPKDLRGPGQNRWGGHQTQRLRGFRGTRNPRCPGRRLTPDEFREVERDLLERGVISKLRSCDGDSADS
jgi:hypothetical protein